MYVGENLPDILTESENDVMLPPQLLAKWSQEGRLDKEVAELNAFSRNIIFQKHRNITL